MFDPNGSTDIQLIDAIGSAEASVSVSRRAQMRAIHEFDRREAWTHDGARHMGQWLAGHLGITISEGLRRTKAAHALEELPLLAEALERGVLSFEKVCQLARYLTPDIEADEVRWAAKARFDQLKRKADVACRPTLDDVQAEEVSRYLSMWECDDLGSLGINGRLPAAEGALFKKAIQQAAAKVPEMPHEEFNEERRNADALLALTAGRADADSTDPDRATVVVHVDLDALVNADKGAEIEGGPVIAPEVASQLLCDSQLEVVVHNSDGKAIGIGRASREVPRWLRRQLMHRDGGCTFCGTKRYLQAHHIVPWEHGGHTDLDNLALVCFFHHKLIHRFGWTVELTDNDEVLWRRPDGTLFTQRRGLPGTCVDRLGRDVKIPTAGRRPIEAHRLRSSWIRAPGFG